MSVIACPECGKDIPGRAVICRHCGQELGEATEQDREIYRARRLRDRIYRLNMLSYLVITVFLAGFGWFWFESAGFSRIPSYGPFIVMGTGAVAYLTVRGFLFKARSQRKAMAQKRRMSAELRKNL